MKIIEFMVGVKKGLVAILGKKKKEIQIFYKRMAKSSAAEGRI